MPDMNQGLIQKKAPLVVLTDNENLAQTVWGTRKN